MRRGLYQTFWKKSSTILLKSRYGYSVCLYFQAEKCRNRRRYDWSFSVNFKSWLKPLLHENYFHSYFNSSPYTQCLALASFYTSDGITVPYVFTESCFDGFQVRYREWMVDSSKKRNSDCTVVLQLFCIAISEYQLNLLPWQSSETSLPLLQLFNMIVQTAHIETINDT